MGTTMEDIFDEMSAEEEYLDWIREKAIEDNVYERVTQYYFENKELYKPAKQSLENAINHLDFCPTSTIIYAAITQEYLLKNLLFKPIIFGVVNNELASEILIDNIFSGNRSPYSIKKLNDIVFEIARIDLPQHKRGKKGKAIWQEITELHKKRNKAMHEGEQFKENEAKHSLDLVKDINDLITTKIFKTFKVN